MALEGLRLGQYRLLHLLGSGGMGEVYLAEDARINQQVAIKVNRSEISSYPNSDTTQDGVRLFQREARAIAKLDHPHILPLFAYGEEQVNGMTLVYMVMPFRPEGSFADWLRQHTNEEVLSVQDVVYFISQAADALQYAHENQVVHQDVKPSNFLVRTNKQNARRPDLLLSDFGIARIRSTTASNSHSIRGTPTYMAPEIWSGEAVPASDQYALAVMTYELLTGRSPFTGRQEQVMYQHFHVLPQPASAFNPALSTDVDSVLLNALEKNPRDRFMSIAAFANALQQATLDLDASTIIKPTYTPRSSDFHVTLAISKTEAQTGANRILTLPGGRQITVTVPAGAYNGQLLRLPQPLYDDGQTGTLILTLSIKETDEIAAPVQSSNFDRTAFASPSHTSAETLLSSHRSTLPPAPHPPSVPNVAESPHPQPAIRQQRVSTATAILLVGLIFVLVVGSLGFFYLYNINRSSSSATTSDTATQNRDATNFAATSTTQANNVTATAQSSMANATNTAKASSTATPVVTTTSNYVQLKSYYSGTASGYADGSVTFTLRSEDQQGNISMQTTFQQLANTQKTAIYSCQGSVTTDRHVNLQCSNVADPTYLLTIQGFVYPDGHMEGTETATNTNDPGYNHVYSWKAY